VRFNGPLETATKRYAREDVTISGVTISCGELVFAVIASANRDDRRAQSPSDPGHGVHDCLRAPLARQQKYRSRQRRRRQLFHKDSPCPKFDLLLNHGHSNGYLFLLALE
jgi:hypothetical protein